MGNFRRRGLPSVTVIEQACNHRLCAGLVEGSRETGVSVPLSDSPPVALEVRRTAVQRQQLPGERLQDVQVDG